MLRKLVAVGKVIGGLNQTNIVDFDLAIAIILNIEQLFKGICSYKSRIVSYL